MIPSRVRAGALGAMLMIVALALATPGIAFGAAAWTITRSPGSMKALSTATFSLVATNIGSGGHSSAIGCVTVSIPSPFTVHSAAVSSASGHLWTASVAKSGSASTVTVRATANSQRLSAKKVESVSFTVNVTAGVSPGAHQWTANAFIFFGCTASYGQPIVMIVTIGALPVNLPPVAVADLLTVPENGTLIAPAPGLLANDIDANGDPLTAQLVTGPSHGVLALAANGSYKYVPAANYSGADSFTYRASDGVAVSPPALVSVTVIPAPAATPTPPRATPRPTPVGSPLATSAATPIESSTGTGPPGANGSPAASSRPGQGQGSSASPAATPALAVAGGPDDPIPPFSLDMTFAGLQFDWFIPAAVVGGPGLLVILAIALQLFGALAWLPAVRRHLGGAGSRRSDRST
jgi:Bacterial Ig domain